jgi:hypothetical protein
MASEQPPTGEWMSRARFEQEYGPVGLDHAFGVMWGPHRNQRVSLRIAHEQSHGVLYVYDPVWDEYNVLDHTVTIDEARRAFDTVVGTVGYRGIGVDALADALRREQLRPLLEASIEPTSAHELGIVL